MKKKTPITAHAIARVAIAVTICLSLPMACQDEVVPEEPKEIDLPATEPTDSEFSITSTKFKETADGYEFDGALGVKTDDGEEFKLGEGTFDVNLKSDGSVSTITGTGTPVFPNVGVFAELLKEFTLSEIASRIEYNTGTYFKETYSTDIPLADGSTYIHFKVLNEERDGEYELRHKANNLIYKFVDLYIDPHDPAVFFKTKLWKPSAEDADDVVAGFWKRTFEKLKSLGKNVKEYQGSPNMIFGISNHARFKTTAYDFNIDNKESFKELFGFDHFESLNSHLYLKLEGVPIPPTVILQLSGEMYVHYRTESLIPEPEELKEQQLKAFMDWFRDGKDENKMATFAGSMDMGGGEIETLVTGAFPMINDLVGHDIFNANFDLDLVGATLQYSMPSRGGVEGSFLRLGGELNKPMIMDILGDGIKPYLISIPASSNYFYFSIGPTLEDCSIFTESSVKMLIPKLGETEFNKSYFLINKDGVNFSGKLDLPLGPIQLSKSLEGKFTGNSFFLESYTDKNITLSNGIVLTSKKLHVSVSNTTGVEVDGSVIFPFGLGEGEMTGQVTSAGMSFTGSLKAGGMIDLGNGFLLPTANVAFSSSTNPEHGIAFTGSVELPHNVGYVEVTGVLTKDGFSFTGIINRQIAIGNVNLLSKSGKITISNTNGVYFESVLELGNVFGDQMVKGHITLNEVNLIGTFNRAIPIAGHSFTFANGKITANSSNGVTLTGNINLYVFNVNVTGKLTAVNNFLLTGAYNHNGTYVKCAITTEVRPGSVGLKGTGTVYGLLGNELYTGTLTFQPNWAEHTIKACYNNICVGL